MQRMAPLLATLFYVLLLSSAALEATAAPVATTSKSSYPSAVRRQQRQQQQQRRGGVHRPRPASLGNLHSISRRISLYANDDASPSSNRSGVSASGTSRTGNRMDMSLHDSNGSGSGPSISGSSGSGQTYPSMSHGKTIPKTFLYHTKSTPVQAEDRPVSRPKSLKKSSNKTSTTAHILQLVEIPIQESTGAGKLSNHFQAVPALQLLVKPHQFDDEDPPPDDPPPEEPPPPTPPPSPPPPAPARFDDGFYHPGYKTIAEAAAAAAAGIFPPFDDGLYHPGFRTQQEANAAAHPPPPPPPPPPPADPPADDPPPEERRRRSLSQRDAEVSEDQRQQIARRLRRKEVLVGPQ
ncbi:unnamed protein product [Tilletia controversa]|nr:unnamed protein product [Tilletia controversa]